MKKTLLKRGTKQLKRSGFKRATKSSKLRSKPRKAKKRASVKKPSMRLLKNKLWAECKRIVRLRYGNDDRTFTCYTCDRHLDTPSKAQTGHYIPSSICSASMRYDLDNLRVQCYNCNINKSGNWPEYERRLERDGIDTEALKQRNRDSVGMKADAQWYEMMIVEYRTVDK